MSGIDPNTKKYLAQSRVPRAPQQRRPYEVIIATRAGPFTAAEVIGVAILKDIIPPVQDWEAHMIHLRVVRSGDSASWDTANFVVGAGGRYDPAAGRFDQVGDGAEVSVARQVWGEYGMLFVQKWVPDLDGPEQAQVHAEVERVVVRPVNESAGGKATLGLTELLEAFNCTPEELDAAAAFSYPEVVVYGTHMRRLHEALELVTPLLRRQVVQAASAVRSRRGS